MCLATDARQRWRMLHSFGGAEAIAHAETSQITHSTKVHWLIPTVNRLRIGGVGGVGQGGAVVFAMTW